MKCNTCGETIKPDCDYRQGRCPHRRALVDEILSDTYKTRFYNLINSIKNWFK
jgi:hypothetical protein